MSKLNFAGLVDFATLVSMGASVQADGITTEIAKGDFKVKVVQYRDGAFGVYIRGGRENHVILERSVGAILDSLVGELQ